MSSRSVLTPAFLLGSFVDSAIAAASWEKEPPSQWTSEDVYQILNNSAWSKSVTVTSARAYGEDRGGGTWDEGMPGGGLGRMGGPGGIGMGGGGMGRRRGGYPSGQESAGTVTVQWQSALPVRLAQAKTDGATPDPSALKPLDEYIVAVLGLPKSGFESQRSRDDTDDVPNDAQLADHLKVITVLSFGHERLSPTKVELNQGRDGRAIFHFEKSEPITAKDKFAEFRITGDRSEIRKKFALKDMEYEGKLEL
jgi:hypothetical protein